MARAREETELESGLEYVPGDFVRVRVVRRERRISVSDGGGAIARAGRARAWREAAARVAHEHVVNVSREGVISLPIVPVGPSEAEIAPRIAAASLDLYQELLERSS